MIRCGLSYPQTVTILGSNLPSDAVVLVSPPNEPAIRVTPVLVTPTRVVFRFVFAQCGTYVVSVTDATGGCDGVGADPVSITPTPIDPDDRDVPLTLGDLRAMTQHRLGDDEGAIWPDDEVVGRLNRGYDWLATTYPIFWDMLPLESQPRGFSATQPWELPELHRISGGFDYGVANFTAEFERTAGTSAGFDERDRIGPGNHTSLFESTDGLLSRAAASTTIPGTNDLPRPVTQLDRVLWDNRVLEALEPRSYSVNDARYESQYGDVYGFMWQKDGVRTLRKVRIPARQGATLTVGGSWGILRTTSDITTVTPTGTWGAPRILEGHHPIGTEVWGIPRRVVLDSLNVRVEHVRKGRPMLVDTDVCELPPRYARYLVDFAMSECLSRPGPGFDMVLAQHFEMRWQRGVARIQRRLVQVNTEHAYVMGGSGPPNPRGPARPRLPANYGTVER